MPKLYASLVLILLLGFTGMSTPSSYPTTQRAGQRNLISVVDQMPVFKGFLC